MDLNRPYAKEVGQKFLDKYGVYLNNEGAKEYVGMYVVKDVLERAASVDHEAIYEAFAATDITEGICTMYGPHICFDETGQYPYKTSLFLVQNQLVDGTVKRVSVYPRELASEGFELIFPYDYAND
jgi:branched-chain amino acid transport system substrate-binding protein